MFTAQGPLGNRGGLAPKIDSTYIRNACLLLKGPKCCVLEGSPHYRGGTVVQFAQVRLVTNIIAKSWSSGNKWG